MQENGNYQALEALEGEKIVNIHEEFYRVKLNEVEKANVF
jgi:hypothetical protein